MADSKINLPEPSSWGESIREYEAAKKRLPFRQEDVVPVQKIGLYERRVLERELDPILGKYRDDEKEKKCLEDTMKKTQAQLEKPRKAIAGTLNIFSAPPVKDTQSIRAKKTNTGRDWNVISHFPVETHRKIQITDDFEDTQKLRPRTTADLNSTYNRKGTREFNVISNHYYLDDEKREMADYEKIKGDILTKYWKTRDFDIVKSVYLDDEKERKFVEQRAFLSKIQGQAREKKLPPSVRYAAGNTYNLITCDTIDNKNVKFTAESLRSERAMQRVKQYEVDDRVHAEAAQKELIDEDRKDHSLSFTRWKTELDRGYDPIFRNDFISSKKVFTPELRQSNPQLNRSGLQVQSTVNFDIGTPGRKLEAPKVPRPATVWDKIQADETNNVNALFNTTGSKSTMELMLKGLIKTKSDPDKTYTLPLRQATSIRTGSALLLNSQIEKGPETSLETGNSLLKSQSTAALIQGHGDIKSNNNTQSTKLSKNASVPSLPTHRSQSKGIPQLDLSRTDAPPAVVYDLSKPGQSVPMVRTGGGGFYDDDTY